MQAKLKVSRRDFLKGVGGTAISTAVVSESLFEPLRAEGAEGKIKVVAGIKQLGNKATELRTLLEEVLKDFAKFDARQANLRLNQSGEAKVLPVFLDWVAVNAITARLAKRTETKGLDLGNYRRGDALPSNVYSEAVQAAVKTIIERDWKCDQLLGEKRIESKLLVQKAGLMYQKFIGLIASDQKKLRCVGTLTVSFEKKPSDVEGVDTKMKTWASWPGNPESKLVKFIATNFMLGGPYIK